MGRFFIITLVVIISTLTSTTFAINGDLGTSKGANGSQSNPWIIEDYQDFSSFCNDPNKWDRALIN